jgi:hypothetical protein
MHSSSPPLNTNSKNKLTGTLSPEFGTAWQAIERIEVSRNAFVGPLPAEWAKMRRLKSLYAK